MVLAISAAAPVAAEDQMHSQRRSLPARTKRSSLAQVPRLAHLPSNAAAARFAVTSLCLSIRSFQPVSGAAATRRPVPSFTTGSGGGVVTACSGSSRGRFSHQGFILSPLGHRLCSPRAVLPNPSLERTSTGKALGPRGSQVYAPPRGPSASPAAAAQLKR